MLTKLSTLPGCLLIVGDFNLHFDDLKPNHVRPFTDLLKAAGMTQHVTQPTHRHGHILDFVISRQCDASLQDVEVLPRCVSDHHAITCQPQMAKTCAGCQENALSKDEKRRCCQLRTGP